MQEQAGGVTFGVRVKPRASREAIEGVVDGALVVRLTAPPVDGEANAALARVLGKALGVPPSAVLLVAGTTGRRKRVSVTGLSALDARRLLVAAAASGSRRGRDDEA